MKSKQRLSSFTVAAVVAASCCCYYSTRLVVTAAVIKEGNNDLRFHQTQEEEASIAAASSKHRRLRGGQKKRTLQEGQFSYVSTHPYYPQHDSKTCSNDGNPPSWMTWSGGYAEAHLFSNVRDCCDKWFPDNADCYNTAEEGGQDDTNLTAMSEEQSHSEQVEVTNYHPRPVVVSSSEGEVTEETTAGAVAARPGTTAIQQTSIQQTPQQQQTQEGQSQEQDQPPPQEEEEPEDTTTFPTSSCGRTLFEAQDCTRLCLPSSGTENNCLPDETCYPNILCPAKQVAATMGEAGSAILNLIYPPAEVSASTDTVNICGLDYNDAESKCTHVVTGEVEYITDGTYIECPDGTGKECPKEMQCFGGIRCPLKPTSSPTLRPTTTVVVVAAAASSTSTTTAITTTGKKDKTEIVGMVIPPPAAPAATTNTNSPPSTSTTTTTTVQESPYSIDKSTLGTVSVASESCNGGCPSSSQCVGNQATGQLIQDVECSPCSTSGQTWWPCDVPGLCWCWKDGTDRIAPAPSSGLEIDPTLDTHYTICDDILSRDIYDIIAPNSKSPYTYTGLCDAILSYNAHHAEKAFGMGDAYMRASELASFLGNTLHESDEYKAPREYLMCGDNKVVNGEVYCKPCDSGSFDWGTHKCSHSLASAGGGFSEYCQSSSKPPEACSCGNALGDGEGYVPAKEMFFGRGAIQLSWNYNYRGASTALTGSPETFCENPDLVATEEKYAWGAGLYFWMEHVKEGTTSHTECLKNYNFGGTLNNINGGLECPAHGGWHAEAVKLRINRYCRAAKALGLPNLLRMDGCAGLEEKLQHCVGDGSCSDCTDFVGKNPGEHSYSYSPPVSSPTTTTTVVVEQPVAIEETPTESLCPEGLMHWEKNPSCCVPNPNFIGDGACDPDAPYNTEECGYDGGDCCKGTCDVGSIFGCTAKKESQFGDYGPFGFYCVDPSQEDSIDRSACAVVEKDRIGDGMCNPEYNTAECNYDGGDCCKDSCDTIHSFYQCGLGVDSFVCRDPAFATEVEATEVEATEVEATEAEATEVQATEDETDTNLTAAPSSAPTKTQTPPPTKEATSPMSNAPTSKVPTHSTCQKDMLECGDGTFVARDPDNSCEFHACPPVKETTLECEDALLECPGGGNYVGRDPANGCEFFPCPVPKPTEVESTETDSKVSPTPRPTEANTGCKEDFLKCSGGQLVFRNPEDSCNFFPCPKECQEDWLECSGGRFVYRNPGDNCNFYPCPAPETPQPTPGPKPTPETPKPTPGPTQKVYTMASSVHEKLSTSSGCSAELFKCPDGRYVGRDPANTCEYFPCKVDEDIVAESEQISAMSSAAMTHDKFTSNMQQLLRTHDKKRNIGS